MIYLILNLYFHHSEPTHAYCSLKNIMLSREKWKKTLANTCLRAPNSRIGEKLMYEWVTIKTYYDYIKIILISQFQTQCLYAKFQNMPKNSSQYQGMNQAQAQAPAELFCVHSHGLCLRDSMTKMVQLCVQGSTKINLLIIF